MDIVILLIMLCALFAATGLLAVGIKWLLVVALVLTVASASTLRFGRMPRA